MADADSWPTPLDDPGAVDDLSVTHEFLVLLLEDRERGRLRELEDYQQLFPGHEPSIARAYARACGTDDVDATEWIGPYRVLEELGRGGQGRVVLAFDERLGRRVAVKVLGRALDEEALHRFRREVETTARIDHPGICTVHDLGSDAGLPWFAMRYVEGESLAAQIAARSDERASPVSPSECARLLEGVARAVHAAHEVGVLHRDLKPANVMVTPDGDPVLLDFGLAHDEASPLSLTLSGDVFGTPAYMAPEQVAPERGRTDARTDVYALGAILHECLTLRRPFEAPTRAALYRAILEDEPPDPRILAPGVPRDLVVVIATAMAKAPDERYATAAELADDLERFLASRPLRARPASPVLRFRRWIRRDPPVAVAVSALAVVLVTALVVSLGLLESTRASTADVLHLADRREIDHLERRVRDDLWPVLPRAVPAMEAWLAEAEAFLARADDLRASVDSTNPDDAFFLEGLDRLPASIATVRRRRDAALDLRHRTVVAAADAWSALGDPSSIPIYGGLEIAIQVGLVPLGPDPASGLLEFAHVPTGAVPDRDPTSGTLRTSAETGLVFVLLPGGVFRMGATRNLETPIHEVALAPFFLSKFEMTQSQWIELTGENPSVHTPDAIRAVATTVEHPVELANWYRCTEVLRRHALYLPTEAQWEYGARAGTRTEYWPGDDRESLRGVANIADASARRAGHQWTTLDSWPEFEDGYPLTAPVGRFRANAFGLHDVHGNVWEWTRDAYGSYDLAVLPVDGERDVREPDGRSVLRGGGFFEPESEARAARRFVVRREGSAGTWGLRPARPIDETTD